MKVYDSHPDFASNSAPPADSIVARHWWREPDDSPSNFAAQAAAAAFGPSWTTPSARTFVDHTPPAIPAPEPQPIMRDAGARLLDRKRRAA